MIKKVILYVKFVLHFWSYNNSLKITVYNFQAAADIIKSYSTVLNVVMTVLLVLK